MCTTTSYEKKKNTKYKKNQNAEISNGNVYCICITVSDIITLIMNGVFADSLLLGYDAAILGSRFPKFRDEVMTSS